MSDFKKDFGGFSLIDYYGRNVYSDGFEINNGGRTLTYPAIDSLQQSTYYWSLPDSYLGDKVSHHSNAERINLSAFFEVFVATLDQT